MKKIVSLGLLGIFLAPAGLSADATITAGTGYCRVTWGGVNVDNCQVTNNLGQTIRGTHAFTPGGQDTQIVGPFSAQVLSYTLSCMGVLPNGTYGPISTSPPGICTVQAALPPAPTTASVSLSRASGYPDTPFTVYLSGNNTPTYYQVRLDFEPDPVSFPNMAISEPEVTAAYLGWTPGAHSFHIKACNTTGCSGWSNVVNYTVNTPPTPTVNLNFSTVDKVKQFLKNVFSRERETSQVQAS